MPWVPIVDGHADTLSRLEEQGRTLGETSTRGHSDLGRLLRAGVSLQVQSICVESVGEPESGLRRVLELTDRFYLDLSGQEIGFTVRGRADLDRLGPGKVGFLLGLEGAAPLGGRPALLRVMFRLGMRLLCLVWNGRNELADGVAVSAGGGLTGAGREIVRLAEELGIVVDLAHLNPSGFWEVMEKAGKPVVVSHANARAVCDHPRNLDDNQLRALAAQGGLVGVNLHPPFLTSAPVATIEDVLRQLDHLLSVAGPHAVGLGLDFDGIDSTPAGLPDVAALPQLVAAIDRLGLEESARTGLLGGNWLRVLRQILP